MPAAGVEPRRLDNRLLHVLARVAVRTLTPPRAKRLVDAVGRLLPELSPGEASKAAEGLGGTGTCLSRALTIAARLPRSHVVIGSDGRSGEAFFAHAWVERDGTVIGGSSAARVEIARL